MTDLSQNLVNEFDVYLEALQWHLDEDIALCLDETPIDRRNLVEKKIEIPTQSISNPAIAPIKNEPLGANDAIVKAKELMQSVSTIEELKTAILNFDGISLKKTAMNMVFADGNPKSKIMIIGNVPEAEEDRQGKAFIGKNGILLDKIIASIGLDRDKTYLTNIMNWRPPGNRSLTDSELGITKIFIEKHIELINPDLIIILGIIPAKTLLNAKGGISKIRGKFSDYNANTKAITIYHPENLLMNPLNKKSVWVDMLKIREVI